MVHVVQVSEKVGVVRRAGLAIVFVGFFWVCDLNSDNCVGDKEGTPRAGYRRFSRYF